MTEKKLWNEILKGNLDTIQDSINEMKIKIPKNWRCADCENNVLILKNGNIGCQDCGLILICEDEKKQEPQKDLRKEMFEKILKITRKIDNDIEEKLLPIFEFLHETRNNFELLTDELDDLKGLVIHRERFSYEDDEEAK